MAIKVYPDRIEFGDYTLRSTDRGIEFDGDVQVFDYTTLSHGYTSGGGSTGFVYSQVNKIDKFPFFVDANSTDVGDLTVARMGAAGQSSDISGYTSGGRVGTGPSPIVYTYHDTIDKFPFSSDADATDVGDLTIGVEGPAGQSSGTHGYSSGGYIEPPFVNINNIQKFSFASDSNASDGGDLTNLVEFASGQSSRTHGYTSGGRIFPAPGLSESLNTIDKFPFATDADATDIANLAHTRYRHAGQSSFTHGYTSGGDSPLYTSIDKFPFSSDADATGVGVLTQAKVFGVAGQSSTEHGYSSGGVPAPPYTAASGNVIDKFPFATDADATDVGDLFWTRVLDPTGQQG